MLSRNYDTRYRAGAQKTLAQIVNELLEIRGDKDFQDTVERLVQAIQMNPDR